MNAEHPVCLGPPVLASAARVARFTKEGFWGTHSMPAIFYRHADAHGDTLALTDHAIGADDAPAERRELTYGDVDLAVRHIAARFEACGLKPGDIVALQLPPQIEAPVATLACLGLGFIVCALPMPWRRMEIEAALSQIGARAIVTWSDGPDCDRVVTACEAAFRVSSIRYVFAFGDSRVDGVTPLRLDPENDGEQLTRADFPLTIDANALAIITWDMVSGEGSRAVARSHNECIASGLPAVLAGGLRDGATLLSPYAISGIAGIASAFAPWLMTGGLLALHRPFDLERWREQALIYEPDLAPIPAPLAAPLAEAATSIAATPPVLALVHEAGTAPQHPNAPRVRSIDLLCLGDIALIARESNDCKSDGSGTVPIGIIRPGGDRGPELFELRCGSAKSDNEHDLSPLLVSGAAVPSAILMSSSRNHGFRAAADDDEFVPTGFQVCKMASAEGTGVFADNADIAQIGAAAVSLCELDELYADCEGVNDAAAITSADPIMGSRLAAAVVAGPGQEPTLEQLAAHLKALGAADFKIPERIINLEFIPRDDGGAVVREELPAYF